MTLTFEHDLDRVKINQNAKYGYQRLFDLTVIVQTQSDTHTHTHTHTWRRDPLLYLDG